MACDGPDVEATQPGPCIWRQTLARVQPCQSSLAQRAIHKAVHTHSPVSGPAHVRFGPLQRAPLWVDQSWGQSPSPPPGMRTRSELGPETQLGVEIVGGRGIPAAHGAKGWGWGFWSAALRGCRPDRSGPGRRHACRVVRRSESAGAEVVLWCACAVAGDRSHPWRCCGVRLPERSGQRRCGCPGGPGRGLMQTSYSQPRLTERHKAMQRESMTLLAILWMSCCWQGSHTLCRRHGLWSWGWAPASASSESRLMGWSQFWGWGRGCSSMSAPRSQTQPLSGSLWWCIDWRDSGWRRRRMLWGRRPPAEEAGCYSEGEHLDHLSISKQRWICAVMFKAILPHSSLHPTSIWFVYSKCN